MCLPENVAIPRGMLIVSAKLGRREQAQVRSRHGRGELLKLRKGVYVVAEEFHRLKSWDKFKAQSMAAGLARPANVLVGKSAAAIWNLPFGIVPRTVELGGRAGASGAEDKTLKFRELVDLPGQPIHFLAQPFESARVTSLPQTLLDLARWHDITDGVQAIDHCLHHRQVSRETLELLLQSLAGRHGVSTAAQALQLAHAAAESPRESVLRVRMWQARLPAPHLQAAIYDERGTPLGRADFFYPQYSLVVEYDGQGKYQGVFGLSPEQAALDEMYRQKEFGNAGLRFVRVTSDTLRDGSWLADLKRALEWGKKHGVPFPEDQWSSEGLAWPRRKRRPNRSQ